MDKYFSRFIEVDLNEQTIDILTIDERILKEYLGGAGLSAKFIYDRVPIGADPLGEENILCFSVGTFAGTGLPTACRVEASAKSPLTGLIGTSNSGNYWGAELVYAGYNGIIIRGRAKEPSYLSIINDQIGIIPAEKLWGLDSWDTMTLIRNELGDSDIQIASIGQAGENRVKYASIQNGPYDAWGRTGLGAVMGSKNLKAIAVRGTGSIRPKDEKTFLKEVESSLEAIMASPFYDAFKEYGTMLATIPYYNFGALPGRNFQIGKPSGWMENRSRKVVKQYSNRGVACISCPIACAHWVEVKEGKYEGLSLKDMEVTPVIGFGAGCDINNIPAISKISEICQRFGLDMVSAASSIAFAMELFQRGLLKIEDIGFSLEWGDEDAVIKLLEKIAMREGIGAILAEGVKEASKQISGSEYYAMHVKGLEIPMIDPRGRWSTWSFGNLTNIRGGDHLRNRNPVENLRFNENRTPYKTEAFEFGQGMYDSFDMPEDVKENIFDKDIKQVDIAEMSKWSEDLISVYNSVGLCIRPPVLQSIGPSAIARLYSSFTGIEMTAEMIMKAGERIWNLQKLFNLREGEKPEDSLYPDRFFNEAQSDDVDNERKLDLIKVKEILDSYYETRGWKADSGIPTYDKLRELGLLK
ncbi:MAG: aldehyde ferredoxin oxidoreductase family protein [Eubacteriales bacterium]|nr:aldehyde ferredoxin oxidoreductase family protein [Eubacteriales bacterium]